MTSGAIILKLLYLRGLRWVIFGGGAGRREYRLASGTGKLCCPDLPCVRHLKNELENALTDSGPLTILHYPKPKQKIADGVFIIHDRFAYQFEPVDGEWVQVDPKKVQDRFRLAGVPANYLYEKLRS